MKVIFKIKESGDLKIEKSGKLSKYEKILLIKVVEKINMNFDNRLLKINKHNIISFNTFSFNIKFKEDKNIEDILNYALLNLEHENLDLIAKKYYEENDLNTVNLNELNKFKIDKDMLAAGILEKDQRKLHEQLKVNITKEDLKYLRIKNFAAANNLCFEDVELIDALV